MFFSLLSFHFEKQMKAEQETFHSHSVPTRNGSQRNPPKPKAQQNTFAMEMLGNDVSLGKPQILERLKGFFEKHVWRVWK